MRALRGGGHALRRGETLQDALCQAAAAPRPRSRTRRARRRTRLRQHIGPKLERLRKTLENFKRIQALALERERIRKHWGLV